MKMQQRGSAMKSHKRFAAVAAAVSILLSGVHVANARTVRVGIPGHNITQAAFYAARDRGWYREEGLEVQLIMMPAPVSNLALIAGNVDFTSVPTAAITAALRGAPLRVLFTSFDKPLFWLYAKPEIRDLKGLKDKKIGTSGLGAAETLLREFLKKQGLEVGRDVTLLNTGADSVRWVSVVSGSTDATVITLPWNFSAEEAGLRNLVSFTKEDMVQLTGSVVIRDSLLQTEASVVEKFIGATLKGHLAVRANRAEAITTLTRNVKISEALAAKSYDVIRPALTADGGLSEESQRKALDLILQVQGIKEAPPLERFFDFGIQKRLSAELRSKNWKP
jgi:ABC-type nitrate/sulfonate/bicarbonate transport system substrate-binding protein